MHFFIPLVTLVAMVAAQGGGPGGNNNNNNNNWLDRFQNIFQNNRLDFTIDYVHNYRFEEHTTQKGFHLIVAISDSRPRQCFLVEVDSDWEDVLDSDDALHLLTEEVYHHIIANDTAETTLTRDQLRNTYGDNDALQECLNHRVYTLSYTPSQAVLDLAAAAAASSTSRPSTVPATPAPASVAPGK